MRDNEAIRAGFGVRAAAFVIDRALLVIALGLVRFPVLIAALFGAGRLTARDFLFDYSALDVACWLLSAAYFVLMTYFTGATLGKKVMHIHVESGEGEALRFIDVLYRETVGRFLSGIMYIGYIMALADREKRAFHDWLCGTCVVYDEKLFRPAEAPAPESIDSGYSVPAVDALPEAAKDE